MGTHFFAGKAPTSKGPGNMNSLERAGNAGLYAARGSAVGAQKDLAAAQALNKAGAGKPLKGGSEFPKGPKV